MKVRALVLEGPRELRLREFPMPEIGDDDGIVRVEACGLCGTDHEQFTGALPLPAPVVPGHETVGTIERIGLRAAERWGVEEGDRVAVEVFLSCGSCEPCAAGSYQRCAEHGLRHSYGFRPVDDGPGLWGGYATHQYLAPDSIVNRVPDGLDPVLATLFNPLGAGVRWATTVPATRPGDVVAVLGPGIRGICSLVAVREVGAGFVMVTGAGPNDVPRLEAARAFGADLVVDVRTEDPVKALRTATGGRSADVVVDVTAKAPEALGQAVGIVRHGGTVVVAGTRGSEDTPGFSSDLVVYKEVHIVGALGVDRPAYRKALEILAAGRYPFADLPRRVAGLEEAADVLASMAGEGAEAPPVHAVIAPGGYP